MEDEVQDVENTDNNTDGVVATGMDVENNQEFLEPAEVEEAVTEEKPRERKWKAKQEAYAQTYALASENEALRQQNASMEELLHHSLNAGAYHYETVAIGSLERAKRNLAIALSEGDVEGVASATAEIAQATNIVNDVQRKPSMLSSNNNGSVQEAPIPSNIYPSENMLYDWLEDNPDLDKGSAEYNENLTKQVLPFINKLENRLKRNNQMHLIASPEYFNIIDEYVDKLKDGKETRGKHFGGVRSRYQSANMKDSKPMALTPQQKKAAAAFHMSEEKYINYLQKYAKEARG